MWRIATGVVVFAIVGVSLHAADSKPSAEPKSRAARKAIEKFQDAKDALDHTHDKALGEARATLVAELRTAQKAALADGDQDEAVALAAKLKDIESQAPVAAVPPKLIGVWDYSAGGRLHYERTGVITCNVWHGEVGRWSQTNAITFIQHEPNGGDVTITLAADGKHALWVYQNGDVATAKRVGD